MQKYQYPTEKRTTTIWYSFLVNIFINFETTPKVQRNKLQQSYVFELKLSYKIFVKAHLNLSGLNCLKWMTCVE